MDTLTAYQNILEECKSLFLKKTKDYGTAWRILRPASLTDQIFIKAKRIRSIQEMGVQKVEEPIEGEFVAIINYCIMALIQIELIRDGFTDLELGFERASALYEEKKKTVMELFLKKNHDYGEAWRDMRVSSMTDLILMKILRVKQIEDARGQTLVSEGVEANYMDMLNYSVFCLIKLSENEG